jgi:tRNA uridine 5-carbamoylmethylation protein Kti12
MERIVIISGKAENGKTELGKYLKQQLEKSGKKVAIMPFAKYLKQILKDYYGWNGEKDEYWREQLQIIGTDVIKKELNMPLFHTIRVCDDIKVIYNSYDYVIIDDWRFQDEGNYVKAIFPYLTSTVRVVRLNYENTLSEKQRNHKSEIDLDNYNFDYTIYTQSGIQHLYDEADRMFKGKWY